MQLVTAPGEKFEKGYFVDVLRRFPEVRSIHWAVNDRPAEVTNLPAELLWGEPAIEEELGGLRFRVRPNAFLQTNTCDGRAALRARARGRAAHRQRDRVGSLLRDRNDRPVAREGRADGVGDRGLGGVGRVRARERRAERDHERGVLRRQRRPGRRRAARALGPARRRRRRSAARRARGQGAAPARHDRRAAPRLRLVQPDDARRRREGRCARSTATSCCARSRSTCSRTRRTSRPSRYLEKSAAPS